MEIVNIVSVLRRRRILLLIGLLASLAAGAKLSGAVHSSGAGPPTGEALAQVAIDTRVPLIVTTANGASNTVVQKSVLLASLMGSAANTSEIARRAGVPADQLVVSGGTFAPTSEFGLFPDGQFPEVAATTAQTAVHTPDVVQVVSNYSLPILQIGTAAPTVRDAVALAQATIATLRSTTIPTSSKALPALTVDPLGAVQSAAVRSSSIHIPTGVAAAIALFVMWCVGAVIAGGLARVWRSAGRPGVRIAA